MKKILLVCFLIFFLTSIAFSQGVDPGIKKKNVTKSKNKVDPLIIESEKAWKPFYGKFSEIIRNKDKAGLDEIISDDFNSTFGESKNKYLNKMDGDTYVGSTWKLIVSMKKVSKVLNRGRGDYESKKYLRRIVAEKWYDIGKKRSACANSKKDDPCGHESLIFEFRNGKWLLVTTFFCECE